MSFVHLKEQFDRDGFVVARQLLSPAELDELRNNLDRYIRQVVPTLPDSHAFYQDRARPETLKQMQHMGCDPFFAEYAQHGSWKSLAAALVGEPAEGEQPEWFNKPPGTEHATPPHQDNYYFNLAPPHVVTLWMALDQVDDENGCLRYVAGSHRDGFRPHDRSNVLGFSQGITDYGPADESRERRIHLQPGDVACARRHDNPSCRGKSFGRPQPPRLPYKGVSCRRDEESFARYQAALKSQHQAMGLGT